MAFTFGPDSYGGISKMKNKNQILATVSLLGLAMSQSVFANLPTVSMTYTGSANFGSGAVGYGGGSIAPNPYFPGTTPLTLSGVGVGGDSFTTAPNTYSFTSASGSFNTWCVDITHWLNTGTTIYTLGSAVELTSVFGATRVQDLTKLVNEQYSKVNDQTTSAAFQLATWAIMFGTPDQVGAFNLNSSTFSTSSGITGGTQAQDWLDHLGTAPNTGNYSISYFYQPVPGSQNLIALTPVPEPETYAMMMAGIGLIGFMASRRKAVHVQ